MVKPQTLTMRFTFNMGNTKKILDLMNEIVYLQGKLKVRGKGSDTVGSVCNDIADDLMDIIEKFDYEQLRKELEEVIEKLKDMEEKEID